MAKVRKWAKQGFLNPADSNDDGWFKFSIRPSKASPEFSDCFIISDCSNKIYLEFNIDHFSPKSSTNDLKARLAQIKVRKRKISTFRNAIVQACDKFDEALDIVEENILAIIESRNVKDLTDED